MNMLPVRWRACPRIPSLAVFAFLAAALSLSAAEPGPAASDLEQRLSAVEQALKNIAPSSPVNAGDNAWMLVSSALVLMMTAPGLILFYGGLVRSKNVLGTMMHSLVLMALVSVLWVVFGYSMAFGEGNAFFGNPLQYFLLQGRGRRAQRRTTPPTIPQQTFMLFQMMFAIITPALISGAFAERMKFSAYAALHGALGDAGLLPAGATWSGARAACSTGRSGGSIPVLDFAGGTVVHISSGVSALVCALVLGKRAGYPARADAAAQRRAEPHRRRPAVGGLVRLQRRQRADAGRTGHERLRRHALLRRRRRAGWAGMEWLPRASPACWAPPPAWSPAWPRSRRPPGL